MTTTYRIFLVNSLSARGTEVIGFELPDASQESLDSALLAEKFRLVRRSGTTLFVEHDSSL